jgi:hypothetical protein
MAVRETISDNYIENSYIIKLCNSSVMKWICLYCQKEMNILNFRELIQDADSGMHHAWSRAEGTSWT